MFTSVVPCLVLSHGVRFREHRSMCFMGHMSGMLDLIGCRSFSNWLAMTNNGHRAPKKFVRSGTEELRPVMATVPKQSICCQTLQRFHLRRSAGPVLEDCTSCPQRKHARRRQAHAIAVIRLWSDVCICNHREWVSSSAPHGKHARSR